MSACDLEGGADPGRSNAGLSPGIGRSHEAPVREHSDALQGRMKAFLCHCRASAPAEEADRIREAIGVGRSVDTGADIGRAAAVADEVKVERLLAQLAFECAALEVLGSRTEFELSCGRVRDVSARVRLPGQAQFSAGEGRTIALALLAAWAAAHLAGMPEMLLTSEGGSSKGA